MVEMNQRVEAKLAPFPFCAATGPVGDLCCIGCLSAEAHLITLLWSLEEQQTFEFVSNCSHSLCERLRRAVVVLLLTCTISIPLVLASSSC